MKSTSLDFLQENKRAPIFTPRWGSYLGRLEQKPIKKILTDPISLCNALLRTQKLFKLDALCIECNAVWIGHAGGWPLVWTSQGVQLPPEPPPKKISPPDELIDRGLIRTLLETLKALAVALPKGTGIIGVVPGPYSLNQQLGSHDSKAGSVDFEWCHDAAMMLARKYGELNALKAVIITERFDGHDENKLKKLTRLRPLLSLLSFYQLPAFLALTAHQDQNRNLSTIADLGFQGTIIDDPFEPTRSPSQNFILGWAVSSNLLERGVDVLTKRIQEGLGQGISLLTTQGEVPFNTDPATLHLISKLCKDFATATGTGSSNYT